MSFETLLPAVVALYALLNFLALPRLTAAWKANRSLTRFARVGSIAALETVRNAAAVVSVVYLLFALFLAVLTWTHTRNATILAHLVGGAEVAHQWVETAAKIWDNWLLIVAVGLLVYFSWRQQVHQFRGISQRAIDDEYDRLNDVRQREPGNWDTLAPDARMVAIDEEISALQVKVQAASGPGRDRSTARVGLKRQIATLREERSQVDYERRVRTDAVIHADNGPLWRRVLLSKGLLSDLTGMSKVFSRLALALLCIAMVGAAAKGDLAKRIGERMVFLDDLRVQITQSTLDHDAESIQAVALTPEDQHVIAQLADQIAQALFQNPHWQPAGGAVRLGREVHREVARRAVLREVVLPADNQHDMAAFSDGQSGEEHEVVDRIVDRPVDQTSIGQIIAEREGPRVKSWLGDRWEGVKREVATHAATYREPLTLDQTQDVLVDRIAAAVFGAIPPVGPGQVGEQVRDAMKDGLKTAVNDAVTTTFRGAVQDLASGKSYEETLDRVRTSDIPFSRSRADELAVFLHERHLPGTAELADQLHSNPGRWQQPDDEPNRSPSSGPSGGPTMHDQGEIIDEIVRNSTEGGKRSLREEEVDALATYEYYFPRSAASQSATPLGETLTRYRLAQDVGEFAQLAELDVARAGSYSMLRGFSRIGGVLIGAEPENPTAKARVKAIGWHMVGRNVTIELVGASGTEYAFGPYDKSLVHQALAYAADGRPVAVTMTSANPVPVLKIHLHPALVNTPLGCRVEELDRLVDTYAGDDDLPLRDSLRAQYYAQLAVYDLAWALRARTLATAVHDQTWTDNYGVLAERARGAANAGLQDPELFRSGSVLERKPQFFDPSVIRMARQCRNHVIGAFEECVGDKSESAEALKNDDTPALAHWLDGPAKFQAWSGVRERPYRISDDLGFLRAPTGTSVADQLWPFDFMVQIAFTSRAINLPEAQQASFVDQQPMEFDAIKDSIARRVAAGITADGFRPQFEELRAFAILQRMFRAGLTGRLGDTFPVERLVELTRATSGDIPYAHTRVWSNSAVLAVRHHLLDMAGADQSERWMGLAAIQAARCEAALKTGAAIATACDFSPFASAASGSCPQTDRRATMACRWRGLIEDAPDLPEVYRVESAFGVLRDVDPSVAGRPCVPLAPRD